MKIEFVLIGFCIGLYIFSHIRYSLLKSSFEELQDLAHRMESDIRGIKTGSREYYENSYKVGILWNEREEDKMAERMRERQEEEEKAEADRQRMIDLTMSRTGMDRDDVEFLLKMKEKEESFESIVDSLLRY